MTIPNNSKVIVSKKGDDLRITSSLNNTVLATVSYEEIM